jgi:hypothetical protein
MRPLVAQPVSEHVEPMTWLVIGGTGALLLGIGLASDDPVLHRVISWLRASRQRPTPSGTLTAR